MGQAMKPGIGIRTQQSMAMTPQLLQSIRMLQWSTLELQQSLRQALDENLMLEADADADADADEGDSVRDDAGEVAADEPLAEVTGQDPAADARVEIDRDGLNSEGWSGGEPVAEDGESWEARIAAPRTQDPRLHALEQLQLMVAEPRQARLLEAMLEAVDDNGYLMQPLDGIALRSELDPPPSADELARALRTLQSVEPSGFGARDLRECLLLQLADLPLHTPGLALARTLVAEHLQRVALHDFEGILDSLLRVGETGAETGADTGAETGAADALDLHVALDLILSCNPRPGAVVEAAEEGVVPDVLVSGTPGSWRVSLNDAALPRIRVNRSYERAVQSASGHKALRDQLQEARWLVRGVEMRNDTLLRTARAVFERQAGFLSRGEEAMVSLTMREIAEAIGMHESTVSRVVNNKWVQTPWGLYELKAFFPSQIAGEQRQSSGTAVKAMIRRIIDAECPAQPLCDADITALLARNGIQVARRTVAKYREAMRIPAVKDRGPSAARLSPRQILTRMAG